MTKLNEDCTFMSPAENTEFWSPGAKTHAAAMEKMSLCKIASLLRYASKFRLFRKPSRALSTYLEGGMLHSQTLRAILRETHDVVVGQYSYGPILSPGCLPPGSRVGAYCSVASGLTVRRRDHPIERPALHPFFYNRQLGFVRRDTIPSERENPLTIHNDVWIGDGVTILSGCKEIGNGAVVAAGAVVTRDVEPYSIVGGVPAKLIRMRFSEAAIAKVEASQWWSKPVSELLDVIDLNSSSEPASHFFGTNVEL